MVQSLQVVFVGNQAGGTQKTPAAIYIAFCISYHPDLGKMVYLPYPHRRNQMKSSMTARVVIVTTLTVGTSFLICFRPQTEVVRGAQGRIVKSVSLLHTRSHGAFQYVSPFPAENYVFHPSSIVTVQARLLRRHRN
jgi:hypothetical protein